MTKQYIITKVNTMFKIAYANTMQMIKKITRRKYLKPITSDTTSIMQANYQKDDRPF